MYHRKIKYKQSTALQERPEIKLLAPKHFYIAIRMFLPSYKNDS